MKKFGYSCGVCMDVGRIELGGNWVYCECRKEKIRQARFDDAVRVRPQNWLWLTDGLNSVAQNEPAKRKLSALSAACDGKIVARGEEILKRLADNQTKSFYFYGATGTLKTTLGLALLQEAGRRGQLTAYDLGRELIDTIRDYQIKNLTSTGKRFYSLTQLENDMPMCLMIDEIEDTVSGLTSYTLSTLFRLIEKAQAYRQQIIITSNRSLEDLLEFWKMRDRRFLRGEADAENYCAKIDRRLQEICVVMELREDGKEMPEGK